MSSEFFPDVPVIAYEGPQSKNPLAFKHYDAQAKVGDKTMAEHLRFSMAYWHTMRNPLQDPFGMSTAIRPWEGAEDTVDNAKRRVHVAFEFMENITKNGGHPRIFLIVDDKFCLGKPSS